MFKITLEPGVEKKLESLGLLILRVGTCGLMLFLHGWPKLAHYSAKANEFPDPLGISPHASLALVVFAEFFCAGFVALGLWTRVTVVPLIINMAVAVFIVHARDPWLTKERAMIYLIPFLVIFLTGAGDYTVEKFLPKRSR